MVWRNQILTKQYEKVLKLTKDIDANYLHDNSGERFLSVGDAMAFLEEQNDDAYKDNIYFVQSSKDNRTYVIFFFPDGGNEEAMWVFVNGRIHDLLHPMLTPEGNVVNRKYPQVGSNVHCQLKSQGQYQMYSSIILMTKNL